MRQRVRMTLAVAAVAALTTATMALPVALEAQKVVSTKPGKGGSPHETVEYTVGDAKVSLVYGRPYLKGRKVETLAPAGKVYRTGADEATTLVTDKALKIGTLSVPAGSYTLYTLPAEGAWQLIVNKQTGQWGTQYSEDQDLGRVQMTAGDLEKPVEQLTIAIQPDGSKHALTIAWGLMVQKVPLSAN